MTFEELVMKLMVDQNFSKQFFDPDPTKRTAALKAAGVDDSNGAVTAINKVFSNPTTVSDLSKVATTMGTGLTSLRN